MTRYHSPRPRFGQRLTLAPPILLTAALTGPYHPAIARSMYKIIGGDGREYGPVPAETIRDWVRCGRANAQTKAEADGDGAWKPLGDFPEFTDIFTFAGGLPPPVAVPSETLLARDYQLDIGSCLSRGWDALKPHYGKAIGTTALLLLINLALWLAQRPGFVVSLILTGALYGGFRAFFLKIVRGQAVKTGDLFAGFSIVFVPLMLAGIVQTLFMCAGFILLVLPGVYLAVAWSFTYYLIVDRKMEFWAAMELSRKRVNRHWFALFGLTVVCLVVVLAGALLLGVGVLLTIPVAAAAHAVAYEDIFNPKD